MLQLHKRQKDYPKLKKSLNNLKENYKGEINKIHNPDDDIIIDANDLSTVKNIDVIFVSSDLKLLRFTKEILKLTKIKDMYFLKDALNKYQSKKL